MMKKYLFISWIAVIFISHFAKAQTTIVDKIAATKQLVANKMNVDVKNNADTFSKNCYVLYNLTLDTLQQLAIQNKQLYNSQDNLKTLWTNGFSKKNEHTEDAKKLLIALLQMPDSIVFEQIAATNLIRYLPPRQTECCAFPDSYTFDEDVYKQTAAWVFVALSTNKTYQQSSNYDRDKTATAALFHITEVGLVDNGFIPFTQNGYSKEKPDTNAIKGIAPKPINIDLPTGRNTPYKSWLLYAVLGILLVVGIWFLVRKKK